MIESPGLQLVAAAVAAAEPDDDDAGIFLTPEVVVGCCREDCDVDAVGVVVAPSI